MKKEGMKPLGVRVTRKTHPVISVLHATPRGAGEQDYNPAFIWPISTSRALSKREIETPRGGERKLRGR